LRNPFFALGHALRIIEPQNVGGCLTHRRHRLDDCARKPKMRGPGIGAWIKKPGEAAVSQDRADIRPFLPVAEDARQRQIIQLSRASMFDADDVVNLKREKTILLECEALLAQTVRPGPHMQPQGLANETAHGANADEPALWPAAWIGRSIE